MEEDQGHLPLHGEFEASLGHVASSVETRTSTKPNKDHGVSLHWLLNGIFEVWNDTDCII